MAQMQDILIVESLNFIDGIVAKAVAVIDEKDVQKEVWRTVWKDGVLRKYINFDEERGRLTRVALLDREGRELYVKELNYQKGAAGYVVAFDFMQKIKDKGAEA